MFSHDKIKAEIAALTDEALLKRAVDSDEIESDEKAAFIDMRANFLDHLGEPTDWRLSRKQRRWVEEAVLRVTPVLAADVPRGREVKTPAVLQNLPKKPPPRRKDDG